MNTEEIIEGYLGNIEVNSIYQGSELIWPIYKYMIGGGFTTPKNKIIRLNGDDSIDDTWYNNNSYTSGTFYKLIYDNINKKIYAGGDPELEGGLVRYNLDGTKDNTFNIGTGFNGRVRSIIIDNTNSKIYVGGEFTTYNGNTQYGLIRLNLDGTKDNTFNTGTLFNYYAVAVWNMILYNNKLYVCGKVPFTLIRLNMNGSRDTSFDTGNGTTGTGFNGRVYDFDIDVINQRIYVVGDFTTYNGYSEIRIAKLKMDGSRDFNIGYTSDGGFEGGSPYAINIDNINSKIYVGGDFTTYYGNGYRRLIRLNMDGRIDGTFNVGYGLDSYVIPSGIFIDNEKNKIYIAGNFTTYNNQQQKYIARLNMDGSLDTSFNIQLNSTALTILKIQNN